MAIENTHREFGYIVTFPCKPGDKVYYIETREGNPIRVRSDFVSLVGVTQRGFRVGLRCYNSFNKLLSIDKIYPDENSAEIALQNMRKE